MSSVNLMSIVGPLAGVVVGSTLTFLSQHLGFLRVFVVLRVAHYMKRTAQGTDAAGETTNGTFKPYGFDDDWDKGDFYVDLELYNGAQVQRVVRNLGLVLKNGRKVIARPPLNLPGDRPSRAMVLAPKGLMKLSSLLWEMKKDGRLTARTRLCLTYQTARGKVREILVQKDFVSLD